MAGSTLTQKGQVTIPKEIRDSLGIKEGDRVFFVQRGDEVVLKVLQGTILDLKGSVPASGIQDFEEVRRKVKKTIGRRSAEDG
jgi:AbrB family looped-hinge helix DNA binding protein